jgi:mRNA interferase MazF
VGTHRKPKRGNVFWVNLDPSIGTKVKKTRPAVILSNDAQNSVGQRVLAAPVTSNGSRLYSFEAEVTIDGKRAKAMLDQVRCLDQSRLREHIGSVSAAEMKAIEKALRVVFDLA